MCSIETHFLSYKPGLAGLVLCLWRGYSLRMWAMAVLLLDIDCICEMGSCPWNDFWSEA